MSVILPVFNGEAYLYEAIDSVLNQTFTDFELIIINDGSTDGTAEILDAVDDSRVRVLHQDNIGLALTLNKGISLSQGEYIARQDADDISLPERFSKQVAFFDKHPSCCLLGTWSKIQVDDLLTDRSHRHPTTNGELQCRMLFDSFFVHSSVMMRKDAVVSAGLYPTAPERNPPEDFDLWLRLASWGHIANLDELLIIYREVPGSISRTKAELLNRRAIKIAVENLDALLGGDIDRVILTDLVAILRYTPSFASLTPDWGSFASVIKKIEGCLIKRWPEDTTDIQRAVFDLMKQLRRARLKSIRFVSYLQTLRSVLLRRLSTLGI